MSLTTSICTSAASSVRSSVVTAFLLAISTFSFGQELKAATTLGFSVRVLGPSTAQFLAPHVTALLPDGISRSVTIPLSSELIKDGKKTATQVIARFHGDTANLSALTARIDGADLQKLLPGDIAAWSVLILSKEHLVTGTSSRKRILELNWKTARTEGTSNLLEIEIRQY